MTTIRTILLIACISPFMLAASSAVTAQAEEMEELRYGMINNINKNMIVIDDQGYAISDQTQFFNTSGAVTSSASFARGQDVSFTYSEEPLTVIHVQKLSAQGQPETAGPAKTQREQPATQGASDNSPVQLKDGVWTN